MYAFNAIQLVAIYAALPWVMQWCDAHEHRVGWWFAAVLFAIGSLFLVVASTKTLYDIDKNIRG